MLARHDGPKLLVIMLHRPMTGAAIAHHVVVEQHPDLEHFSLAKLNQLARQAMGHNARGQALRGAAVATVATTVANTDSAQGGVPVSLAELDRFALDMFSTVWHRTVMPLLETLMGRGCGNVCLVPSDDLQLVPWSHFAATAAPPDCRVEIYPSCGAWVRCRLQPEPEATAAPRWAVAAWAALDSDRPLPWVEVERYLSARLWNDVSGPVELLQGGRPQAGGVAALLGMGHGGSPDDNPANAGLAMAGDQILSAHALPGIRTCCRVVLSACALGRIDDAFGEPLGFLSSCFDYGAGFGTGWLTEVPDAAACWASLALQFALRRAYALGIATPVRWGQVFRQTRLEILSGTWPDGFAEWLA